MNQEKKEPSLFARRLRALMDARHLTQKQIADAAGISQPAVIKWLRGSVPGGAELLKLAAFLEISPEFLLGFENINLTDAENIGKLPEVKRTWKNLLIELRRATERSGKVSELAEFLSDMTGRRVPVASVSRWLADTREPGAIITMLMLQWVECERVKQKRDPQGIQ